MSSRINASAAADGRDAKALVARTRQLLKPDSDVGRSFAELAENLGSVGRPIGSVSITGPEAGGAEYGMYRARSGARRRGQKSHHPGL